MADEEHLRILNQGIDVWNTWRREHNHITPNLENAKIADPSFYELGFAKIGLKRDNLKEANLNNANRKNADLSLADLTDADFSWALSKKPSLKMDFPCPNVWR
ncbi:MAG: pentapeptide repeat-containing protein [Geminicoccales bacterium]